MTVWRSLLCFVAVLSLLPSFSCYSFFFNDTATTEIYTLSLTTLFRSQVGVEVTGVYVGARVRRGAVHAPTSHINADLGRADRKSTRLNSSHEWISYAVFCLKKKKENRQKRDWTQYERTTRAQSATAFT